MIIFRRRGPALVLFAALAAAPLAPQAAAQGAAQAGVHRTDDRAAPVAQALRGLAAADADLAQVYAARDGAPLWSAAGGPLDAAALLETLEAAPGHALPAAAYGAADLRARLDEAPYADPARRAALDLALSRALARYAGDMAAGALRPSRVDRDIHVFPERPEAAALLAAAQGAPNLRQWLARLAPQDPDYAALRRLYAQLQAQVGQGAGQPGLAEGPTLRRGDAGPRVAQLRARLAELGHPATTTDRPDQFDAGLDAALRDFQARNGLNADGAAGRMTFAALGADPAERMRLVAVNLERLRWAPRAPEPRQIRVNLPDYTMRMIEDGQVVHEVRAVIGRNGRETQEFSAEMTYLVVNPTWHVPRSIATRDILPILREDPGYLDRKGMRLISSAGTPPDPADHDFSRYSAQSFPYRIRQAPGPANSLGRVKFMFPNQFNIYLHDTPDKHLFRRDARAYSSGCVRVDEPFRLAHLLLAANFDDPVAAFDGILATGRERYVTLARPIPVHIVYRTAWVDPDGRPQFRADIYGRDARIWAALEDAGLQAGL